MPNSREAYHKKYYELNKARMLGKALARYRKKRDELSAYYRNKYTPKKRRHSIYR